MASTPHLSLVHHREAGAQDHEFSAQATRRSAYPLSFTLTQQGKENKEGNASERRTGKIKTLSTREERKGHDEDKEGNTSEKRTGKIKILRTRGERKRHEETEKENWKEEDE